MTRSVDLRWRRGTRGKRALGVVALVALASVTMPIAPAQALVSGTGKCDVTFDVWPIPLPSWNSNDCVGSFAGVVGAGPLTSRPCATCYLDMSVSSYWSPCVPGLNVPPLSQIAGTLSIDGYPQGNYQMLLAGAAGVITSSNSGPTGVAEMAMHPPITTCVAPGQLTATIAWQASN